MIDVEKNPPRNGKHATFNREKSVGKAREIPGWGLFPAKNGMKSPFEKSPP